MPTCRPVLAILVVLATACPSTKNSPAPDGGESPPAREAPALAGHAFLSQSVTEGGTPRPLVGSENLRLSFHEGGEIGASAGCNSLGGSYRIDGGRLVLSEAAQTEMGCEQARLEQDEWYFGLLGASPTITLTGDRLVVEAQGARIEYLDKEVATPDLSLSGQRWTVSGLVTPEVASAAAWSSPATLEFTTEGRVKLSTGCNQGGGAYVTEGDHITFSEVAVTKKGCTDELSRELEQAVLSLLSGPQPVTWTIDASRLTLTRDGTGLALNAAGD